MKKIVAVFAQPDMTLTAYHQVLKDLTASGAGHPNGRLSHFASSGEKGMVVVDTYDSIESLQRFGETLMPVLVKNGINPPVPEISVLENEIYPPTK